MNIAIDKAAKTKIGMIYSLAAGLAWALTAPGLRYILSEYQMPSLTLALWRDIFAAVAAFAAVLLIRPSLLRVSRQDLRGLAITGIVSIGIYHAIWTESIRLNGASVALVLIYLYVIIVAIGAWLLWREPLTPMHIVAAVLAIAGSALVVRIYDPAALRFSWLGIVIGLSSALAQSVFVLYNQHLRHTVNAWAALAYTFLFGSITLLVLCLLTQPISNLMPAQPSALFGIAFLAIGPTLCGYGLFTMALKYIPGKLAGLIAIIEIVLASFISWLFLGEKLETLQVLGISLVIIAIVLPNLRTFSREIA